ncbi:hypothetical protein AIOL_001375 [Candidatus Rhodobacter oscarellae]|uniref:Cytoskeleton protein RodZ-like C-terminal domain-containing protein n=1 Tax=Candidatus Rhodobacter oscarellae TaxID=1675527 RepID=A0A0J9E0F2_9RHOB|nr:helix-turn-helix domain-containing protein [Candidatus Rhodobacter lobularis]KMW56421.1 hypothetical protein AIOL_001375 [Candidatus Rhodobacter lobularis]
MKRERGAKGMIGRRNAPPENPEIDEPKGFDDFDLRLGDIMRGERATLGKSLLDVQRELKIKASYIAAIENSDPSAFETPGFIAGYVRSYARYLGLDPEWAFSKFCEEGNFTVAHGLAPAASGPRTAKIEASRSTGLGRDPFEQPNTPFVPRAESIFSRIEPGALGSAAVLVALIGVIGYGGWTVLQEVQRVQFAPVDQAPGVTAEIDPLTASPELAVDTAGTLLSSPSPTEGLDRLYRPQALDVPVMTARDAPIASLDPTKIATLVEVPDSTPTDVAPLSADPVSIALAEALGVDLPEAPAVQVTEKDIPEVVMYASNPAWVRVSAADGTTLFERIMDANETWTLPKTEVTPLLRTGYAGAIYFLVDGQPYGPAGKGATVGKNIALSANDLKSVYGVTSDLEDIDLDAIIQDAVRQRDAQ